MKRILTSGIAALAAVLFIAGCENDPSSSPEAPDIRPMTHAGRPDAVPAITYTSSVTAKGKTYQTICVMDSDGTDQTEIFRVPVSGYQVIHPTWSPQGSTIAFIIRDPNDAIPESIYLRDISVSNGRVSASNTRTLCSVSTSTPADGFLGVRWSSLASTNKIAFNSHDPQNGINKIQVVSASGGTPTTLYQSGPGNAFFGICWSPDDSKIAVCQHGNKILVIDASTGALLETISLTGVTKAQILDWSRAGLNQIVVFSPGEGIYYVTPTTGSTPVPSGIPGIGAPSWSPNNSSVISQIGTGGVQKTVRGTTTTTTIVSGFYAGWPEWKK